MKLDPETAQAMTNLRASSDFRRVYEWLRNYRMAELTRCGNSEGTVLFRAQGAQQALQKVIDEIDAAPETLRKLTPNR